MAQLLVVRICRSVSLAGITLVCVLCVSAVASAQPLYQPGATGVDVSWPAANCRFGQPANVAFGIVGVTGGLDFTPNSCLITEASWFGNRTLYMNTGWPGASFTTKYASRPRRCPPKDNHCLAYNFGYNAAEYALLYAASQNVHSTIWWLDVETENSWSNDVSQNRAALDGMIAAIKQTVFLPTIGIYSTPKQWKQIMGDWRNGTPNWVGTGSHKRSDAVAACHGSDFTGGGTQLTQYILTLDHDYVCG